MCHELGHAVLDSVEPQLWDAASIEVAWFPRVFRRLQRHPGQSAGAVAAGRGPRGDPGAAVDGVAAVAARREFSSRAMSASDPGRGRHRLPAKRGQLFFFFSTSHHVAAAARTRDQLVLGTPQLLPDFYRAASSGCSAGCSRCGSARLRRPTRGRPGRRHAAYRGGTPLARGARVLRAGGRAHHSDRPTTCSTASTGGRSVAASRAAVSSPCVRRLHSDPRSECRR